MVSILLPTYNDDCTTLAASLAEAAQTALGSDYELLVADDGSTDEAVIKQNRAINDIANARYIERKKNVGRAAIRNFLAREARGEWLLFVDAGLVVEDKHFLCQYRDATKNFHGVLVGGTKVGEPQPGNIRWIYEHHAEPRHNAPQRQDRPYRDFRTACFMIQRSVFLDSPIDERFQSYGYEDVLFGISLQRRGIPIRHISAPLTFDRFEDSLHYMSKIEEAMRTLFHFQDELRGYSPLLHCADTLQRWHLAWAFSALFRLRGKRWRRNLTSNHPYLPWLNLYKLGYFLSLRERQ